MLLKNFTRKKCWNEDPLKRRSTSEVKDVIEKWIFRPVIEKWIFRPYRASEELKSNITEFINAPIGHNNLATETHPKACYKSRFLNFTSKELTKYSK